MPSAPEGPRVALAYQISSFGVTGLGDETIKVNAALAAVALSGGVLDFEGKHVTAAMVIPATPNLIGQVRNVTITNCMGSVTAPPGQPVLRMAENMSGYFIEVSKCLLLGTVDYGRFYSSRFADVWVVPPTGGWGYTATGPAYYNVWDGGYVGGPQSLSAFPSGGPATAPNTNRVLGTRFQGTVLLGPHAQNWIVDGAAFESCGSVCLDLAGTRLDIRSGNRFEGAVDGIVLRPGSDGWIGSQYWSSLSGQRIRFAGADPLAWWIAPQPSQH